MSEINEFFEKMPERVDKSKIAGMNATYQFNITGDNGADWSVAIADGNVATNNGAAENPNITLTISDENFTNLIQGKLNGQTAFLTGKLKIQGDMTLAMKLQSLFSLG